MWVPFGYAALFAGLAWMLFARNHWPGSRGLLLGASGLLVALVPGAAGSVSVIRRFARPRVLTLYLGGIALVVLSAVLLFILAAARPD